MKKTLITLIALCTAVACTDDNLPELNVDVKRPREVPYAALFSSAQLSLTDALTSSNVNLNVFRLLAQYWTQTTYIDESNYDLSTRNIPQNFWHELYTDVLKDLAESKRLLENDQTVTDASKGNQRAMIEIMEVYTYSVLVNTFGNIPYTEALNIDNIRPKYDDAATIHADLVRRLDVALAALNPAAAGFGSSDLIYTGNITQWVRFGNSLKLKLGMLLADVDPARAKTIVEQAAPNAFQSNADNANFEYSTIPPNTNPIWVDLVQSGRQDFVVTDTLVKQMDTLNDPRIPFYFTIDPEGEYTGGDYGSSNDYASVSKPDSAITRQNFEALLLDYPEVEFYLAEAVERGFNVGGTAASHYDAAITASILYWGGSQASANAYLAQPRVAYATAFSNYKEKIGLQKWIALYNRGYDAWTEWRRLDYPFLTAPEEAVSVIPLRFPYPVSEQNLNVSNYNQAASAVGGDVVATKLFWDRF